MKICDFALELLIPTQMFEELVRVNYGTLESVEDSPRLIKNIYGRT